MTSLIVISNATKKESWQSIESYITEHTTTKFSHGICPDCMKKLYPEFTKEEVSQDELDLTLEYPQ